MFASCIARLRPPPPPPHTNYQGVLPGDTWRLPLHAEKDPIVKLMRRLLDITTSMSFAEA